MDLLTLGVVIGIIKPNPGLLYPTITAEVDSMNMTKLLITAIAAVGAIRFALTVAGLPDSVVKYASMTAIIAAGAIYFAVTSLTWRSRLKAAYLLILPYVVVEACALGYELATGRHTIFHAPQYSFKSPLKVHFIGHLIGGLTWEPLSLFLLMEIIWGVYAGGRMLLGRSAQQGM